MTNWNYSEKNTLVDFLLQEIGDFLLQENGDKISLEQTDFPYSTKNTNTYNNSSKQTNSYVFGTKN